MTPSSIHSSCGSTSKLPVAVGSSRCDRTTSILSSAWSICKRRAETTRWQPVSPTLMRHLLDHAKSRNAPQSGQLLRYRNGKPISSRPYDHVWAPHTTRA